MKKHAGIGRAIALGLETSKLGESGPGVAANLGLLLLSSSLAQYLLTLGKRPNLRVHSNVPDLTA